MRAKLRDDRTVATHMNQTWSMDFVHDQLATGRKLTVVDTFSRVSPTIDPRLSHCGKDAVRELESICGEIGYPKPIRVD